LTIRKTLLKHGTIVSKWIVIDHFLNTIYYYYYRSYKVSLVAGVEELKVVE
jgi:hypothetical protein